MVFLALTLTFACKLKVHASMFENDISSINLFCLTQMTTLPDI